LAVGTEAPGLIGPPGWPVRYALMFGFSWFLAKAVSDRARPTHLIGLALSSLEVVVAFHKVFIFGSTAVIIAVLAFGRGRDALARWLRVGLIVLAAAMAFVVVDAFLRGEMSRRAVDIFYDVFLHATPGDTERPVQMVIEDASGGRLQQVWPLSLEIIDASPLIGSGWEQSVTISTGRQLSLHNGFLDVLASVGILGAAAIAVLLFRWFNAVRQALLKKPHDPVFLGAIAYAAGLLAVNLGGVQRHFFGEIFFAVFVLSVCWGMSCFVLAAPPKAAVHR
jgi:O-antigen ligase